MAAQLTAGAVKSIYCDSQAGSNIGRSYVLQVVELKKIGATSANNSAQDRFRVVISDGQHNCQAMLATQQNQLVFDNQLEKHSIIEVQECICNVIQNRKIVILLNLKVLAPHNGLIGNPVALDKGDGAAQASRPANAATPPTVQRPSQNALPIRTDGGSYPGNSNQNMSSNLQGSNNYGNSVVKQEPSYSAPAAGQQSGGGSYGAGAYNQGNRGSYGTNQGGVGGGGGAADSYQGAGYQAGGQRAGQQSGRPGDWTCPQCNVNVYASKPACFKCGTPKIAGSNGASYGNQGNSYGSGSGHQQQSYPPPGGGRASGIVERDMDGGSIIPILDLHAFSPPWTIQGRITVKGSMRTYKNARGEGRLFSIDIMDSTGDIRGTFFNETADQFHALLKPNHVYKIRGGTVKAANRQYNQCKSDYEITFNRDATFIPCEDHEAPKVSYNFRAITEIENQEPNSIIDVIGIAEAVFPISSITVKSGANAGNQIAKRDALLVDQGGKTIRVTFWDEHKDLLTEEDNGKVVVAIKGVRVSDYNGRSLSTTRSSMVEINPDIGEGFAIRGWYDANGAGASFSSVSGGSSGGSSRDPRKMIADIKEEGLGHGEKPDYFTVRVWVTYFSHEKTWHYVANPETKKKVTQQGDQWFDDSTGNFIDRVERRYVMSISASDVTGSNWFSAFNDQGIALLGKTADAMHELKESDDPEFGTTFERAIFKPYTFKVRAKAETYNDETRVKCTIQDVHPVDWKSGARELKSMIDSYGV